MSVVFTELLGGRVLEVDDDLEPFSLTEVGGATLSGPSGPGRDGAGAVVVAELFADAVAAADPYGAWVRLGTSGSGAGEFRRPVAAAWHAGRIVVLDGGNCRLVFVDDIGGSGWATYGHRGAPTAADPVAEGAYAEPRGLAVDSSDRIWVADPGAHRLTRIDGQSGGWVRIPLPPAPKAAAPYGICAYGDGVAVLDAANRRLLLVDDTGTTETPFDAAGWPSPTFVAAAGTDLVVADLLANELRRLQITGSGIAEVARLRGSPPDVVAPLFDSIGGVGS